jgi:putative DNA primase/helicase
MLDERVFTQYAHEATTTNTPDDEAQRLADISRVDKLEQERINPPDELAAINKAVKAWVDRLPKDEEYSLSAQYGGAVHIYHDVDGSILYIRARVKRAVLKHDGKDKEVRPFKRGERGAWVMGEPKFPTGKPLYNLHALHARPDERVFVVEGEHCADYLMAREILATTSGGASSDEVTDWRPLAGRDVIIWADNDDLGAGYQNRVTSKLHALGCTVKHIDISQLDLPPKGDSVDWLKAFADAHGRKATATDIWGLPCVDAPQDTIQGDSRGLIDAGDMSVSTTPESLDDIGQSLPEKLESCHIMALAVLSPIEYEQERVEAAKRFNVRASFLDGEVRKVKEAAKENRLPFPEYDPCDDPINPAELLDEVKATIKRFIILDDEQATAAALWCAMTWFIDRISIAPLCIINAPEKACGKSQLLTVMGKMSFRPITASNASVSALFRSVELWKPTILIDEADTFFGEYPELTGLVNAGFERGAIILRSEATGDSFTPKPFPVYSAKAIAGIQLERHLKEATLSRGIIINLRKKLSGEATDRLRHAESGLFDGINSKLARFAEDYGYRVHQARPQLPDSLGDRDQDCYEPLLAIASMAGNEWLMKATSAALVLCQSVDSHESIGNELLADIRTVFELKRVEKISTADLITALIEDDEAAWATYNRGKPISPRQLSYQLKGYGITSKQWRPSKYENPIRGFELDMFREAFERYLSTPPNLPLHVTKSTKPNDGVILAVTDGEICNDTGFLSDTAKPSSIKACNTVTDKSAILGESKNSTNNQYVRF